MEERMQQKCDDSTEDIFKTVLFILYQMHPAVVFTQFYQCRVSCLQLKLKKFGGTDQKII